MGTIITDKDVHCSPFPDVISQGADKLFGGLVTIGIIIKHISTTEELGLGGIIINIGDIRKDGFCGSSLIAPRDVENRVA